MTAFPIILQRPPKRGAIPIIGGGGGGPYSAVAATFDGTSDYMSRGAGLTGAADGKKGIFSCWVKFNGGDGTNQVLLVCTNLHFFCYRDNTNKFILYAENSAEDVLLRLTTTTTFTVSSGWLHVLASWDMSIAGARHLYINDIDVMSVVTFVDGTIDYTNTEWHVGSFTSPPNLLLNGCNSELYFNIAEYLDFSVESNRRKFIDASGAPVSLGSDGSTPTGTAPIIYLKNAYDSFGTNSGTGGNFSVTGALAECADPPP